MVEARNALVTNAAVLRSDWSTHDARAAELTEVQVGRLRQFNNRLHAKTVHAVTQDGYEIVLRCLTLTFWSRVERMTPGSVRHTLRKLYMSMTDVTVNGSMMSMVLTYGQKYTNHVTYIQNLVAR